MGSLADVKVTRFVNEVEAGFTALQVNTLVTKIYDKFEVELPAIIENVKFNEESRVYFLKNTCERFLIVSL